MGQLRIRGTLLDGGERGRPGPKPQDAIDRLANLRTEQTPAIIDITLLRSARTHGRARGDDVDFKDLASRYHAMANRLTSKDISPGRRR
jgi:hypothetical protein